MDESVAFSDSRFLCASFEQRFNCLICWAPRLRMIYGCCQHRLCENCLYDSDGSRRLGLEKCPTCQRDEAFPALKPSIPEDNIAIQAHLGVRKCTNDGCHAEIWHWELQSHLEECSFSRGNKKPRTRKRKQCNKEQFHVYNLRQTSQRLSNSVERIKARTPRRTRGQSNSVKRKLSLDL